MRKKLLVIVMLVCCLLFTGCFKKNEKDILNDFSKKIEKAKGYHLTGDLEIFNNEETYQYYVDVSSAEGEKFRVSLKNKTNNHEQIILRNDEGVYV